LFGEELAPESPGAESMGRSELQEDRSLNVLGANQARGGRKKRPTHGPRSDISLEGVRITRERSKNEASKKGAIRVEAPRKGVWRYRKGGDDRIGLGPKWESEELDKLRSAGA